jgi:hypothetical protein
MLEFFQRGPVKRQLGSCRAPNGCTGRRIAASERSLRARPSLVTLVYRRCQSHRPVLQLSSPHSNSTEGRFAWAAKIDQGMNQSRVPVSEQPRTKAPSSGTSTHDSAVGLLSGAPVGTQDSVSVPHRSGRIEQGAVLLDLDCIPSDCLSHSHLFRRSHCATA